MLPLTSLPACCFPPADRRQTMHNLRWLYSQANCSSLQCLLSARASVAMPYCCCLVTPDALAQQHRPSLPPQMRGSLLKHCCHSASCMCPECCLSGITSHLKPCYLIIALSSLCLQPLQLLLQSIISDFCKFDLLLTVLQYVNLWYTDA